MKRKKTAKQELYEDAIRSVKKYVEDGLNVTKARMKVAVECGLSFNTVRGLTRDISTL